VTARASEQHTRDFIEQIAVLLEADGLPRVAGRIFSTLLVSKEPRSLDDLASQLGVSKASISINVRLLEEKGTVERISRQADRRDYYRLSEDILERTLEQRIARWRRFHDAIASARQSCGIKEPVVRARLEAMDHVYRHMLDATSRALEEWRAARGQRPRGTSATQPPARSR
jgi:DNA-binding transcriptional regulator GbsR (MarR family)